MNEQKEKTSIFKQLTPLIHLWPALLTITLIITSLPGSRPVLSALPEKITLTTSAQETNVQEEEAKEVVQGNYEDGVYTGSAQGYGGLVTVQVTVEKGQIVSVKILSADGETTSFFNRAMNVIEEVLTKQSWQVDIISGATYSSNGILGAIQNALTGEEVVNESPAQITVVSTAVQDSYQEPENGYLDGNYTGTATGFGGDISVEVQIADGKISSVSVLSAAKETKSYWNKAIAVIDKVLDANSPNVDTVSGATYSSTGILNAIKRALSQAVIGSVEDLTISQLPDSEEEEDGSVQQPITTPEETPKPEESLTPSKPEDDTADKEVCDSNSNETFTPDVADQFKDGEYSAVVLCTDEEIFSYQIQVTIRITEGKITEVAVEKKEDNSDDPESNDTFLNYAINGRTRKNIWYEGLIKQILSKQSAENLDAVSSATYSSSAIQEAASQALKSAQ